MAYVLKNCRFCGGTAHVSEDSDDFRVGTQYSVWCDNCHIHTGNFSNRDSAVAVWNFRRNIRCNLNDSIRVRLTDYGKSVYAAKIDAINAYYGRKVIKDNQPSIDAEGYSRFQLWDFMNIFGEVLYMGNTEIVIENQEFELVD